MTKRIETNKDFESKIAKQKRLQGFRSKAFNCCENCINKEQYGMYGEFMRCAYNKNRMFPVESDSVCKKHTKIPE